MKEVVAVNEESGGGIYLLHDVLSNNADDPSMAVARKLDWEEFCADLPANERAVVEFLVEGASSSAIARKLKTSDSKIQTIKRHLVKAIVEFMGVTGKNLIWGENTGLLRYFTESSAA